MTPDADLSHRPDAVAVIFIAASPARVWEALTDPAAQPAFFGGATQIGEEGERWIRHATDKWPALTGVVLVREPPRRLVLSWGVEANPPPDRVEFHLAPTANGTTRVTISEYHGRSYGEDHTGAAAQGWAALLSGLKTLLETGKPLPSPF